jgi:hypothetical protein
MGPGTDRQTPGADRDPDREWARDRVKRKQKLRVDVAAYALVNAFLIVVWALTDRGYFWPGWVLSGWAVLLIIDASSIYLRRRITDDDIDRELRRRR